MNMNSDNRLVIIVLLAVVITRVDSLPFGSADPNAPQNPFGQRTPFQSSLRQDSSLNQGSSIGQSPQLFQPSLNDDASNWPTPPPIGGELAPSQQIQQFSRSGQNSVVSNSNQVLNFVTPPPLPGFDPNASNQKPFATSPAEAHVLAKKLNNPFDNLPVKNTIQQHPQQFQTSVQSTNPFDALPIRTNPSIIRQKRQSPSLFQAGKGFPVNTLSNAASSPMLQNPSFANNNLVSGFPNTNGQLVLAQSPNLPDPGEPKRLLPNHKANPQTLVMDPNGPLGGNQNGQLSGNTGKILLPNQKPLMQSPNANPVPGVPQMQQPGPINAPQMTNAINPPGKILLPQHQHLGQMPQGGIPSNPNPGVPQVQQPGGPWNAQPMSNSNVPQGRRGKRPSKGQRQQGQQPFPDQSLPGQPWPGQNVPGQPSNQLSPNQPLQPWQDPNKIPPSLRSNPALPQPLSNQVNPPLQNPVAPNQGPNFSESKVFLPNQANHPETLVMKPPTGALSEPKPMLPSQIAILQQVGGTG